jgi:hypothetical protein
MEASIRRPCLYPVTPDTMRLHEAPPVQYLDISPDRRVAYRHVRGVVGGKGPTIMYIPGTMSTMEIHKAKAMEQYAKENGLASLRYDMEGLGRSTGELSYRGQQ